MYNSLFKTCILLLPLLLSGCYGINTETSQIGSTSFTCLSENAWNELTQKYSTDKIKDKDFIEGLNNLKNHFLPPEYILYFESGPREIIGCDYYSIRVVYNPEIFKGNASGLTTSLSDDEQVRIRNRILKLLYPYECPKGQEILLKQMEEPAVFGEEYYKNK